MLFVPNHSHYAKKHGLSFLFWRRVESFRGIDWHSFKNKEPRDLLLWEAFPFTVTQSRLLAKPSSQFSELVLQSIRTIWHVQSLLPWSTYYLWLQCPPPLLDFLQTRNHFIGVSCVAHSSSPPYKPLPFFQRPCSGEPMQSRRHSGEKSWTRLCLVRCLDHCTRLEMSASKCFS